MLKKYILIPVILLLVFLSVGCTTKETTLTDAEKFKQEYESVNGESNTSGNDYRVLSISENNPFIYKEASDIVDAIKNEETFVVYFGFKTCPWCRSILPTLINVSKDLNLKKIYYVDILDIRDTLGLDDDGKVITTKEGTKGYYDLLEALDNVLADYSLTNDGKAVKTNEKRIYAPNVVAIVKGKAVSLTTGISKLQTDSYMELTEEMIKDTYEQLDKVLRDVVDADLSCDEGC